MATPQMPQPPYNVPPQPQQKKSNILVWILVAVFGLILMAGILFGIGAFFVARKVKEVAGGNPAAVINMLARMNPNVEVVSSDEGKGTVTVRDKSTGKVVTMNFDDIKNGKMVIQEDGKEAVTIETKGGENGSVEVKTADGVTRFGANAGKVPAWVPAYPGSSPQAQYSSQAEGQEAGSYSFKTADGIAKVSEYYQKNLKDAGFKIALVTSSDDGAMVNGTAEDGKRTVLVTAGKDGGDTAVNVVFTSKK